MHVVTVYITHNKETEYLMLILHMYNILKAYRNSQFSSFGFFMDGWLEALMFLLEG